MKKTSNTIYNIKGFSLVETLVASAILAVLLFSVMAMVDYQLKSSSTLATMGTEYELILELQSVLEKRSLCTELLANAQSDPNHYDETSLNNNLTLNLHGNSITPATADDMYLSQLKFHKVKLRTPRITNAANNIYLGELEIQYEKVKNIFGTKLKTHRFLFNYKDNGGLIEVCGADLVDDSEQICNELGGTWDSAASTCDMGEANCESLGGIWSPDGSGGFTCDLCQKLALGSLDLSSGTCTGGPFEPTISFQSPSTQVLEGAGAINLTVVMSAAAASDVTVRYRVVTAVATATSIADYTIATGYDSGLNFSAGQTSKLITLDVVDDVSNEGDEQFALQLYGSVGATITDPDGHIVTIQDNDTASCPDPGTCVAPKDEWNPAGCFCWCPPISCNAGEIWSPGTCDCKLVDGS